jgi:hypothetical protein
MRVERCPDHANRHPHRNYPSLHTQIAARSWVRQSQCRREPACFHITPPCQQPTAAAVLHLPCLPQLVASGGQGQGQGQGQHQEGKQNWRGVTEGKPTDLGCSKAHIISCPNRRSSTKSVEVSEQQNSWQTAIRSYRLGRKNEKPKQPVPEVTGSGSLAPMPGAGMCCMCTALQPSLTALLPMDILTGA